MKIGGKKEKEANMEEGGGTDHRHGGNVTTKGEPANAGRQREGLRLSPSKPKRKQH